ncbi:Glu/Leu/Phe/Val dehydrogenase [Gracilibacillus oryzae]|uniref:Glutamate dehydrogenase n=1 Tax=Gracilibacillus oryzae TaxID=1672701 RepID=A0A7C8KVN0_9BACI|nr:Glu/Leu/Phe/Val dehydrogenase [Gracilibacillus oryzae]KAB8138360.1 Glu/Leu/Phe/Val dehydrogenase [Gracilibacillus oryzae]
MRSGYEHLQHMIKDALTQLGYPDDIYELIKEPSRLMKVRFPVRMDDDSVKIFTGFRAQHHDVFGVTQGNVHFRPDITEDEIAALSILRSVKASNLQLPLGGSSGGIICDLRELSFRELERLCRAYIRAIQHIIGPSIDIPTSDASVDPQIMAWMMDEYSRLHTGVNPNFITGKPYILGGINNKQTAVEKGVYHTVNALIDVYHLPVKDTRVMIHGTGIIGSYLAEKLYQAGIKIVGISDPQKALYNPDGLNIPMLLKQKDNFGIFSRMIKDTISLEEFLEKENDMFIITSKQEQVDLHIAKKLNTSFILETVNNTLDKEAIHYLDEKGIVMIPEVLATNGGIVYAYLEWMEYKQGKKFTDKEIDDYLKQIILHAIEEAKYTSLKKKVNMYSASYMLGMKNQAEAIRYRGWL